MAKTEVETAAIDRKLIGAWDMNNILRESDLSDDQKIKLVDLWTAAHQFRRELDTLRQFVKAVNNGLGDNLPY